jgi:hypothetical protein
MNRQSVSLLCDEYQSGDIDRAAFIKLYNNSTKDYGFSLINNNCMSDNDDLNQLYGVVRCPTHLVR